MYGWLEHLKHSGMQVILSWFGFLSPIFSNMVFFVLEMPQSRVVAMKELGVRERVPGMERFERPFEGLIIPQLQHSIETTPNFIP